MVDAIKVVTDAQGATGTGLTAIPWNASWDAEVQSEVTDALNAMDIDGYTGAEAVKLILAAVAGKLSGAATTTATIRAADDSKARITATVDADGNRSAVTLDATG